MRNLVSIFDQIAFEEVSSSETKQHIRNQKRASERRLLSYVFSDISPLLLGGIKKCEIWSPFSIAVAIVWKRSSVTKSK